MPTIDALVILVAVAVACVIAVVAEVAAVRRRRVDRRLEQLRAQRVRQWFGE